MNRKQSSRYILAFLTAATLLAFFALQAGAVTTVTTPITGTVDTTRSGDIQILVSSDGSTISSDAGGDSIYAGTNETVSIDKMSGGPDSLAIIADRNGINVASSGLVSSDVDLVIKSGADGVYNSGGTVNLAGVSIDAASDDNIAGVNNTDIGNTTISGDKAVIKAMTTGEGKTAYAVSNTGSGAVSIDTGAGGVELIVSAVSGDAAAVSNTGGGTVSIKTAGQISYDITAQSAKGMYNTTSQGAGVTVSAAKGSSYKVTATSGDAYGIEADNSTLAYGKVNNVNIAATKGAAYGLAATNGGTLSGDGTNSIANVSVTENTAGYNASGVYADSGSRVMGASIDKLTVNSAGYAYGVNVKRSTATVSSADLSIGAMSVSGDMAAYGINADGGSVKLAMNGDMDVKTAGDDANGVYATGSDVRFTGAQALTVSADNGGGYGIYARNSSVSGDAQSLTVSANSSKYEAKGLYATQSGDVKLALSGDLSVENKNGAVEGIRADNNSRVKFTGVKAMTVSGDNSGNSVEEYGIVANSSTVSGDLTSLTVMASGTGARARGIYASNSDVELALSGDLTVEGRNGMADGITAINSDVTFTGVKAMSVSSGSGGAYGIQSYGSTVSGDLAAMTVTANGGPQGICASDSGVVNLNAAGSVSVTSKNSSAYGINISSNKVSTINIAKDLTVKGAAGGAGVTAAGAAHQITVGGLADVSIAAGGSNAIYAADNSSVNLNGGASLDVTGTGDVSGIRAESGGKITVSGDKAAEIAVKSTGGNAYGILVSGDQASVKFNKINNITVNSAGSGYGLYANSSTDVSGTINNITVSASGASGDAYGIYAPDKSTSLDVKVTGKIKAVSETGKAVSIYSKAGTITTEANDASIIGDVKAEGGSQQAINMTSSDLTGAVNATGGATVGLSLDAKSVWNVTGDSSTNGELAVNGGTVNFLQTGANSDDVNKYRRVAVKTLSGKDGVYKMHADIESGKGDQIVADNSDNLFGKIEIISPKKTGPYRARMTDDLVIVRNDKNSSFTLVNNGGCYEYGAWKFVLASEDLSGAALASVTGVSSLAAASDTSGLGWYLLNTQQVSSTATAVFDSLMAPTIGHLEEGALYSQLGDQDWITSGDRTHVWGYAVYSKFKYTDHVTTPIEGTATGDNYAENKYYGLTGGMDKVVHESDSGTFRLGAMMGYGEGNLDMDNGDASDNSFHAGVYGIYRFNSGLYLAGIAKYNRYRTDVTARPTEGGAYEASYNQDGFGISALAGKRFDLRNSWYVEPQAELGWARIGSASYTINNLDVAIDSTNSVRGRLGFSLGRRVATETGKTLDFYVKASVIREFDGETDLTMSGDPFKADFGGTWGQYKLGVNYWNNDNFMLHGALVYENGENYESPIGVELGLNWFTGPKTQKDEAETAAEVTE